MYKIRIEHEVRPGVLADILQIASTGSIEDWAEIVAYTQTENPEYVRMEICEQADDAHKQHHYHKITPGVILQGMQRILDLKLHNDGPSGNAALPQYQEWILSSVVDGDATMIDTGVADAIIQFALFNELRY
jgi:hypothetical protein